MHEFGIAYEWVWHRLCTSLAPIVHAENACRSIERHAFSAENTRRSIERRAFSAQREPDMHLQRDLHASL